MEALDDTLISESTRLSLSMRAQKLCKSKSKRKYITYKISQFPSLEMYDNICEVQ